MFSRNKKKTLGVILSLMLLFLVLDLVASLYLVNFALSPHRRTSQEAFEKLYGRSGECRPWIDSLRQAGAWRDTFAMINGTRLHALYIPSAKPTNKVVVLVHGYRDSNISMLNIGRVYYRQLGFNLFLPDLYAHGQSDGNHIQMGWNDRLDVMKWLSVANHIFKGDSAQTQMVIHGVSMGAATTMALSGEKLPPCVKCLVEDCGYTSVHDEFVHELSDTAMLKVPFAIPRWPILPTASMICRLKYGWNFEEASMLKQVKKCRLPMMFIHGDNDDFVPTAMVYPLYHAKSAPKELYMGRGSRHARTYVDHSAQYTARLKTFVEKYMY